VVGNKKAVYATPTLDHPRNLLKPIRGNRAKESANIFKEVDYHNLADRE
jgi:hypothetical protein